LKELSDKIGIMRVLDLGFRQKAARTTIDALARCCPKNENKHQISGKA
jgi:hypothetical protein